MKEEELWKMGARVGALEMVVKTLVALVFASTVKEETGFAGAAQAAIEAGEERIKATLPPLVAQLSVASQDTDTPQIMLREMEETVGRCFDQPAASLSQVADAILQAMKTASEAKN